MLQIIRFCVHRPVAVIMFYCALTMFGVLAALNLPVDYLPAVRVPELIVTAAYPNLPPEEIREMVTIPLEDTLSSLKGLKHVSSLSRQDISIIELGFDWGTDMKKAGVECRELIDIAYAALPAEAEKPVVVPVLPDDRPVMIIAVTPKQGPDLALAHRLCEREVATILRQIEGVGTVTLTGGYEKEIRVRVLERKAAALGLSLGFIQNTLAGSNVSFPAGVITEGKLEYIVKADGRIESIEELEALCIPSAGGETWLPLREIAHIGYTPTEQKSIFACGDREGIGLVLRRQDDFSPVRLSAAVREELDRLEQSYGRDLSFTIVHDSSVMISDSVRSLLRSSIIGLCAAFLVILLFLRRIFSSLILLTSFPASILFCLIFLYTAGRSINIMSLSGMVLGIGMIVDNGIVVLENLERKTGGKDGNTGLISAAAAEMAGSTFGSTCTTLIVFLPLIFLPGVIGSLFTDVALSVSFSLAGSFICSITLVPVLYAVRSAKSPGRKRKPRVAPGYTGKADERSPSAPGPTTDLLQVCRDRGTHSKQAKRAASSGRVAENIYRRILALFFRRPALILLLLAAGASGIWLFPRVPKRLTPPGNTDELVITLEADRGTSMENLRNQAIFILQQVSADDMVRSAYVRAGGEDDDIHYQADMEDWKEKIHIYCFLREDIRDDAETLRARFMELLSPFEENIYMETGKGIYARLLGIRENSIDINVTGDNPENAWEYAEELASVMRKSLPNNLSVELYPFGRSTEMVITPRRDLLSKTGLTVTDISREVKSKLTGQVATSMDIDGEATEVRVMGAEGKNRPGEALPDMDILIPEGGSVGLGEVTDIARKQRFSMLLRKERKDIVTLRVSGADRKGADEIHSILSERTYRETATPGDRGVIEENIRFIVITFGAAFLLMYLFLGAQFESFIEPLILLSTFPLSLTGIFAALAVTGRSLDINSAFSFLVLLGVSINNAIILFETYKKSFISGGPGAVFRAVYGGSVRRIIPILMTLCTTVFALVPISIDPYRKNSGSGMSAAVIGGLLTGTLLTAIVQPLLFYSYFKRRQANGKET